MNIVVWNMGRRDDTAAWRFMLDELEPDIALLQETTPPASMVSNHQVVHSPAYPEHPWGSAVYTRLPMEAIDILAPHAGWYQAASISLSDDRSLIAISIHAQIVKGYVRPNIDRGFEALRPMLDTQPFVLGGDFNLSRNYDSVYGSTHHTEFLDGLEGLGYVNCHRKFHDAEEQTFWGARTRNAYQDDHVFVSEDLGGAVTGCDVVLPDRFGDLSDHSPLVVNLNV